MDDERAAESLTARTVGGVRWTYLSAGADQVLALVSTAVLARLLEPRAFGLVAMAGIAMTFVKYFAEMGLKRAIVQRVSLTSQHVRAGVTSSAALGSLAFGTVWLLSPVAATVFDEPELVEILRLMGVIFVLASAGMTAHALMERKLQFKALALRSVLANVLGLTTAIVLALRGFGVFALVFANLAAVGMKSLLAYVQTRHALRPTMRREPYQDLFGYGSRSSIVGFLEYLGHDLDTLLVGRWVGAAPLGLYNRAELIVKLPSQTISTNLSKVLFPILSSIQFETSRLRRVYLQAIGITAALVVPLSAGIAVAADEIIDVVLGPRWSDAAPLVPWFAIAAAAQVIGHYGGVLCDAKALLNQKITLTAIKVGLLGSLLSAASLLDGLHWYAVALAVTEVAAFVAYSWVAARALEMPWREPLLVVVRPLLAAAWVALLIGAGRAALVTAGAPTVIVLLACVSVGAIGLAVAFRWGPLVPVRDQLVDQLLLSGVAKPRSSLWRAVELVVGRPRR